MTIIEVESFECEELNNCPSNHYIYISSKEIEKNDFRRITMDVLAGI